MVGAFAPDPGIYPALPVGTASLTSCGAHAVARLAGLWPATLMLEARPAAFAP
jgi:hypothetical protein